MGTGDRVKGETTIALPPPRTGFYLFVCAYAEFVRLILHFHWSSSTTKNEFRHETQPRSQILRARSGNALEENDQC